MQGSRLSLWFTIDTPIGCQKLRTGGRPLATNDAQYIVLRFFDTHGHMRKFEGYCTAADPIINRIRGGRRQPGGPEEPIKKNKKREIQIEPQGALPPHQIPPYPLSLHILASLQRGAEDVAGPVYASQFSDFSHW